MATELCSNQEAGNDEKESTTLLLQDPYEDDETLSLSDLPIISSSAQWGHDDFNKEDGKNSRSYYNDEEDGDDFFEFISEDFTTSTSATAESIIFCGKLIPVFKEPPLEKGNNDNNNKKKKVNLESKNDIQKGRNALLPSYDECFKKASQEAKSAKSSYDCEYSSSSSSSRKVSLVRSTTKSRWYLFMFGMSRLSSNNNEMELRDIRSRQRRSRRRGSVAMKMFPAPEHGEEVKIKVRRNYKGLWKVLRSISLGLGCKSSKLANDVVKAAFV
ncbi:hypothetical protein RIF29_23441 [Crotalaria pallida]|uniref:Uncharacterized protein n=1 Tax=Crotalaria pallida TaxID=3830 RepID=A0AAN9FAE0_CROPI